MDNNNNNDNNFNPWDTPLNFGEWMGVDDVGNPIWYADGTNPLWYNDGDFLNFTNDLCFNCNQPLTNCTCFRDEAFFVPPANIQAYNVDAHRPEDSQQDEEGLLPLMAEYDTSMETASAFAKLVFPDGDYFVQTTDVTLCRDVNAFKEYMRLQKAERRAQDTLDLYRQEPSQPSQPGDGDENGHPSASSQSLDGRPAPPSNLSEHGGIVSYQAYSDPGVEAQVLPMRQRRSFQFSKSSSTNSVAPANLHPNMLPDYAQDGYTTMDGEFTARTSVHLPVHTSQKEDITLISKEHLRFSYNFEAVRWELHVLGRGAFVNEGHKEQGEVVPLGHNDEIMVATLRIIFKLPDSSRDSPGLSHGTFSTYSGEEEDVESLGGTGTSPVRRLSNAMEADEFGEENGDSKSKLKLKLDIKQNKGKKPKAATKEPAEAGREGKTSPPSNVPQIEPGSALANIPIEELPEKRKGPGRPPKNGILSKRDQALAKRKAEALKQEGLPVPDYNTLVQLVRAETKLKEQHQKGQANGQPLPDTVVPSIETQSGIGASSSMPGSSSGAVAQPPAMPVEPARKTSPKTKRTAKSPSPIKPESEFTDEQLKKPNLTYVHLIDEILREHPTGQADLPEIYDRIMKKYPHYKYRVHTAGWQSSVRHNLLSCARFKDSGKSGKGKLWVINYDVPIEKEKKRKPTPPKPVAAQNGQYMHTPQYGQHQYGNPYATHQPNGQPQFNGGAQPGSGSYLSPYGQPGQKALHGAPGPSGANTAQGLHHTQNTQQPQHVNRQQPSGASQLAAPVAPHLQPLVVQLMGYRERYLAQFLEDEEAKAAHEILFQRILFNLSDMHERNRLNATPPPLSSDADRKLYDDLNAIFKNCFQRNHESASMLESQQSQPAADLQQTLNQAVEDANAVTVSTAEAQKMPITASPNTASMDQTLATMSLGLTAPASQEYGYAVTSSEGALQQEPTYDAFLNQVASPGTKRRTEDDGDDEDGPAAKRVREE